MCRSVPELWIRCFFSRMRSAVAIAGSFAYRDLCHKSKTASTVVQTVEAALKGEPSYAPICSIRHHLTNCQSACQDLSCPCPLPRFDECVLALRRPRVGKHARGLRAHREVHQLEKPEVAKKHWLFIEQFGSRRKRTSPKPHTFCRFDFAGAYSFNR